MASIKGGDKLEAALASIAAKLSKPATLQVGFPENSTDEKGSIPLRAAMNEFGHDTTPPRPFFRNMIAAKSGEWPEAIGELLIANNYDVAKTLGQTGQEIKGQLQASILEFDSVPLAQSTIDRKGFDKQLVETGNMVNAVDYVVKA